MFILPPQYVISKTWQQIMFCKSSLFNFQLWKPESQLVETAWHCQIWNFVFLYFCICNWKPSVQLEETAWHCPKPLCRLISDSGQLDGRPLDQYFVFLSHIFHLYFVFWESRSLGISNGSSNSLEKGNFDRNCPVTGTHKTYPATANTCRAFCGIVGS